eukprot:CAMPEP_0170548208 /NCGR_PEP_ID=MMETSP0211-20121228/6538_1 /TAXON_ID=311385 /ORGANISM="Pseudokeronopsis sp., Strain OXSARD2" /LENGTH=45 /DNA_ID= /DNA_START= /DNA_END= /DNA_ORIENTATION=
MGIVSNYRQWVFTKYDCLKEVKYYLNKSQEKGFFDGHIKKDLHKI